VAAVPWRSATRAALYGPDGFFVRGGGGPAAHFRTSVHASRLFASAIVALARSCSLSTVVDVGAGGGELLSALTASEPSLRLVGVDVAPRPAGLDAAVEWTDTVPDGVDALVVANEWLDDVPVDVVEVVDGEPRVVLVEPSTGVESIGPVASARDTEWLARWWPLDGTRDGVRAEVGWPRDEAWRKTVRCVPRGVVVAVDYGHLVTTRPAYGTLTGYRDGRQVDPVPDGSCDVTAHIALDAVAAAGVAGGASSTVVTTQHAAMRALVEAPAPPSYEDARRDPAGALGALSLAGEWGELTDPGGLGGFGWVVHGVGVELPAELAAAEPYVD